MLYEDWTRYGFWVLYCEDGIIAQSSDWGTLPAVAAARANKGDPLRIGYHHVPRAQTFGPVDIPAGAEPYYFRRIERVGGRLTKMEFHVGYRDGERKVTIGVDAESGSLVQALP
jgi:hypothetical protein